MNTNPHFEIFAWFGRQHVRIGQAHFSDDTNELRLSGDKHLDAAKVGRAMLKGDVTVKFPAQPIITHYANNDSEEDDEILTAYDCFADASDQEKAEIEQQKEEERLKNYE